MLAAVRQASRRAAQSARNFTSSAIKQGGAHEPDYVHAPRMYDITSIKNRKFKFGLAVGGTVALGIAVPLIAAEVQFARMKG